MSAGKLNRENILKKLDAVLSSDRRWVFLLFFAAFFLKFIYVIQSSDALWMKAPILDAKYYDDMARDIAMGRFIRPNAFFMGPLYPYFLGFFYSAFGRNLFLLSTFQMLGGSLTVVLVYLIGSRVFRPSIGFLGALLQLFYGATTFYEGQFLMMWLGTLINMTMLLVLHMELKRDMPWKFVIAGVLLGLSALARASILVFLPVVVLWIIFLSGTGRRLLAALIFVACVIIAVLPATIHNYYVERDFVPVTSNWGFNFFIGNNPAASGAFSPVRGVDQINDASARKYAERILGRGLKTSEVARYWFSRALEFIKENPGAEAELLLRKTAMFFNGFEMPQIESYDLSKKRYGIFRVLRMNFYIICTLGLIGILYSIRFLKKRFLLLGFVASYSFSIIIFFITARYRIQIVPVLSLFAAYSLLEVFPGAFALSSTRFRPFFLLAVLLFLCRPGILGVDEGAIFWRDYIHRGRRLGLIGKTDKALKELNKAVALRPDDPESYIQRAIVYKEAGRLFQAIEDYTRALKLSPEMPAVHYDLAQALREARMYGAAAEEYKAAIALDTLMIQAYNNLGLAYKDMGDYDKAVEYFEKVISMNPRYTKAYNNLGASLAESGDLDAAIEALEKAIEVDSAYANSYKNLAMAFIQKKELASAMLAMRGYLRLRPDDKSAGEILEKLRIAVEKASADTTGGEER